MAVSLFFWEAASAKFSATAPPATVYTDGTNFPHTSLAFAGTNGSADEFAYFVGVLPEIYGAGNIIWRIYWSNLAGGAAGEFVSWDVAIIGRIDDEVWDTDPANSQTVNDAVTVAADLQVASTTSASMTLAAGDIIVVQVSRDFDEAAGGTGLPEDANFFGLQMLEA